MAIDAIIDRVYEQDGELVLDLMPREVGGLKGQAKMYIKNPTHTPKPGQQIWGNSGECIIEPGEGVNEKKRYLRIMYTGLHEAF